MKSILSYLILFFTIALCTNAQTKYGGCCIEQIAPNSNDFVWENDSLKFTFVPSNYFWKVTIENKTDTKASCLWDETLFIRGKESSGIVFNNTIGLKKNDPKGESIIPAKSQITKSIYPLRRWDGEVYPVFYKKDIKKQGDLSIRLIFPISFEEYKQDYVFSFNVFICDKKKN